MRAATAFRFSANASLISSTILGELYLLEVSGILASRLRPADVPYDSVGESDKRKSKRQADKRQVEKMARTGNPECW